ncbi:MAG: metal-sensitive transcriptional regulator [Acidimicrobiales bacterium]
MELPDKTLDEVRNRLRRVEGQVRGIVRMIDEKAECRDLITQIAAANKALEQAGLKLVASGLTYCLSDPEKAAEGGYGVPEIERMLMRLR